MGWVSHRVVSTGMPTALCHSPGTRTQRHRRWIRALPLPVGTHQPWVCGRSLTPAAITYGALQPKWLLRTGVPPLQSKVYYPAIYLEAKLIKTTKGRLTLNVSQLLCLICERSLIESLDSLLNYWCETAVKRIYLGLWVTAQTKCSIPATATDLPIISHLL